MTMAVQAGDVLLGKYRVEHVLGQGGMGVVVAARHIELGELFAIKFLLPAALESAEAVERFLREARASARLKGEHVAKVHDVGRLESGAPYMVMEHLAGSDLQQILRARGPLPVEEATTYVIQACEAIGEAHALGIVHRDLKPANLFLVRRANGSPCVKVLDFGISKQVSGEGVDLTQTGALLGSPLFMSPEQMMRTKHLDARSDIWSMGVVLYQLVTGVLPFPGTSIAEVIGRVLQEEPVRPSQVRPGLPPGLDAVIAGCLQKRPEQRFQNVGELVAALCSLAGGGTVMTAALSPGMTPASARASQSDAVLVPATVTGSSWGATRAGSPSARSRTAGIVALALVLFAGLSGVGAWLVLRTRTVDPTLVSNEAAAPTMEPESPALAGTAASGLASSAAPTLAASAEPEPEPIEPIETPVVPAAPSAEVVPVAARPASTKVSAAARSTAGRSPSTAPSASATSPAPVPTALAVSTTPPPTSTTPPIPKKHEGVF